jgi:PAS domain S-box-containing protein
MQQKLSPEDVGGPAEVRDKALAVHAPQRVGWFRFYFDDDHWEWSPEVEKMHGYPPESVTPTTELVLSHKHPDDFRHIADVIELIRRTRQPLSTRHRIVDVQGAVHHVVVVGDQLHDDRGDVVGTHGFYVDVTPAEHARQEQMSAELAKITENRAVIEQAKGMLMVIYAIDDDTAFELLRWRSQETHVKLRLLAQQIITDFRSLAPNETLPPRATYDNLLLTAHQRITPETDPDDEGGT